MQRDFKTWMRWVMVAGAVAVCGGCEATNRREVYALHFTESTAEPAMKIRLDGKSVPLEIAAESDRAAADTLGALTWNVLYADNKIFLEGTYQKQTGEFVLRNWYIEAPFVVLRVENEMEVPHEITRETRTKLQRGDFKDGQRIDDGELARHVR